VIFFVRINSRDISPPLTQLTALTTSFCVDFLAMDKAENANKAELSKQDILFIIFFFNVSVIVFFNVVNDSSVVGMIFEWLLYLRPTGLYCLDF
jgi:hypothetical protein